MRRADARRAGRGREEAGLSLFFASVMLALLSLNLILLYGGRNALLQQQAALKMEQEAERALSCYSSPLYERYGLWGMRADLAAELRASADVARSLNELEGAEAVDFELYAPLEERAALKTQITAFMAPRLPLTAAEEALSLFRAARAEAGQADLSEIKEVLGRARTAQGFRDLASFIGTLPPAGEALPAALPPDGGLSPAGGGGRLSRAQRALLEALRSGLQEAAAAELDLGAGAGEEALEPPALLALLSEGEALLTLRAEGALGRLAINEYALRMFAAGTHTAALDEDYSPRLSLRGKPLTREGAAPRESVEFLIKGGERERAERGVARDLALLRFVLRLGSAAASPQKMAEYRRSAAILSLAVMLASAGKVKLEGETLAYALLIVDALKQALADLRLLLDGERVALLPDQPSVKLSLNYHDYLRLFLLQLDEALLLERLAAALGELEGCRYFTGVRLQLRWSSPYWRDEQVFATERRYALYAEGD